MKPAASPEQAIREIVASQADAWNAGDGRAYARHFAPDGSFTNIYGQSFTGHAAFEQRHVAIFASFFRGSTLTVVIRRLRFPVPDVAIVEIDSEVRGVGSMPPGIPPAPDGVLRTRLMQVFVQADGAWLIAAHHNVAIAP